MTKTKPTSAVSKRMKIGFTSSTVFYLANIIKKSSAMCNGMKNEFIAAAMLKRINISTKKRSTVCCLMKNAFKESTAFNQKVWNISLNFQNVS